MKNFVLIAAFGFVMTSFSVNAQEERTTQTVDPTAQTMEMSDKFDEIDKSQLPQTIKDLIMTEMDGMKVMEAFVGKTTSIYKVLVAPMDDETKVKTVYADAEGQWVEPKKDEMSRQ
ncbi:MAG: hypothetical protein WA951_01840 [Leeuwenhoekiella sp.]